MSKRLVRFICLLLLVALPSALLAPAHASLSYREADAPEVYVNAYGLNIYDKPSTKSKVREIVPFARNVKLVSVNKGWAKVYTVNRVLGYCDKSKLSETNLNTLNVTVYPQAAKIEVYRRPDVTSSVVGVLNRNDPVTAVAMTPLGDWLRIERDRHYGYVQRPRVDTSKYAKGKPAWCANETMTVYYDYRLDTKFTTLHFGQQVTLLDKQGSWAKIRSGANLIGFCQMSDLTTSDPNSINTTVYTQADGNFMFKSCTDLSGRVQVDKNEEMTLLALDSNRFWARVQYGEDIYYIPAVFLGTKRRGAGSYKKVTATAGMNIREGTKKSSAIVATVPTGTEMWLVDALDNRAKVTTLPDYEGKSYTGFVELQYLK